jgi:transcriptional regulator with XRE-family HTH domain
MTKEKNALATVLAKFGKGLVRVRKSQGISQEELAFKCGIDRSYMGNIERGESSVGLTHVARLANALNMKISELMEASGL